LQTFIASYLQRSLFLGYCVFGPYQLLNISRHFYPQNFASTPPSEFVRYIDALDDVKILTSFLIDVIRLVECWKLLRLESQRRKDDTEFRYL